MSVNGNFGIGTAADGVPLHVSGPGWNIKMSDSSITSNWAILTNNGRTKYLRFYDVDNSVDRLVIDSSGNVGIGTSNPPSKTLCYWKCFHLRLLNGWFSINTNK